MTDLDDQYGSAPTGNVAGSLASAVGGIAGRASDWYQAQPAWTDQMADATRNNDLEAKLNLLGGFAGGTKLGKATTPIKAYHVSPYDFKKFNSKFIGEGEGTANEGHGLYFTTSPRVKAMYQDKTTTWGDDYHFDTNTGKTLTGSEVEYLLNNKKLLKQSPAKNPEYAASDVYDSLTAETPLPTTKDHAPFVKKVNELGLVLKKPITYEVNINAHPDDFLHWDKPLNKQSAVVQQKVTSLLKSVARETAVRPGDLKGSDLYENLSDILGNDALASNKLKKLGIPGVKYLDPDVARTRHNYVVFNDKLIDIVKKYGMAGLVAGGSSHFSTSPVDDDPWTQ